VKPLDRYVSLQRIISGGQTGADRAALDAALELGFPCGGWCPQGRLAEDGPLASVYPLQELPNAGYRQRTIKNIESGDGTAIFYFHQPVGGTELTLAQCIRLHKPYKLIDAAEFKPLRAGKILLSFTQQNGISVLNIAGPSERRSSSVYAYVHAAVRSLVETGQAEASGISNQAKH
jgi:hypothetical protein